ncbi:MAG TPA: hypothetical protein VG433_14910 [Pirellulales bacterium]|nr:hypothetical protein [Pirellulales bacterium]
MRRVCHGLLALGLLAASATADDFCVQNKVYFGKDTVESTTVFSAGTVYDFLESPQEITLFDAPRNRFVVLDPTRRIKTEVTTEQVDAFTEKVKGGALDRPVPLLLFLANPKFDEKYDEASGELVLSSEWMKYKVKTTEPKQEDMPGRYYRYSNWQVKLATLINPGSTPPFARLLLNGSLAKHGRVPSEVELTRYAPQKNRHITLRAEHHFYTGIGRSEQKKIEEANRGLVLFSSVPLKEYYQKPETEEGKSSDESDGSQPRTAKKS